MASTSGPIAATFPASHPYPAWTASSPMGFGMPTHRAVHVAAPGQALALAEVETTSPQREHVRITVAACGVCGTDQAFVAGGFPGMSWPLTPGPHST
jgi:hypothetical protein